MNIVFDLDGTLIDSKPRLYQLFLQLAPDSHLSYAQYWEFKKHKVSNEMILANRLGLGRKAIELFVKDWMGLIEAPELLALDANFPGMHETLARLRKRANLHVCTARQFRAPVLNQLERLDLLPFFNQVLVTEQQDSKEALIRRHVSGRTAQDWTLGDTGKDVQVGKLLKMNTCAVLSGFLNRTSLLAYEPDLILDSASDFRLSPRPQRKQETATD